MSYVIVIQDPNQTPDTLVGPFDNVESAQEYMKTNAEDFTGLEMTLVEEWEGEGDVPPVNAFIAYMNAPRKIHPELN